MYLPAGINFVNQFITMLYGSWKYVNEHRSTVFTSEEIENKMNTVDLIVFANEKALKMLPPDCRMFFETTSKEDIYLDNNPACLKVEQQWETGSEYKNLNSYIMFLRRCLLYTSPSPRDS